MPADRSRASRHEPDATFGDDTTHALSMPSSSPYTLIASGGIAFAPNVTPGTFNDPPPPLADDPPCESLLFPPENSDLLSARKAVHSRKKPENYIPRPPNAFILFRSAFIRSRHVSTGVETNHSTLSKIIGMTWQNLPNEERQIWHRKAKLAEEQHRVKFPQYAFKPLHSKGKGGGKRKVREVGPKDQKRCAKIAELLVQGKKGQELDEAIQEFDKSHVPEIVTRFEAPITEHSFQRSVSAPIPEGKQVLLRKPRSFSSQPSRRSTPAISRSSSSPSPAPIYPPSPLRVLEQASSLFTISSIDFPFQMKGDSDFDFNSFPFNSNLPSSLSTFSFDPHSQPTNPLATTFPDSSPNSNHTLVLPQLNIDTSFVSAEACQWSPCHSPCSPVTNSMPATPAYSGTPLPEDVFGGSYHHHETPEYCLQNKSIENMPHSNYGAYQDQTQMGYSSAGQYSDPHCNYSSMPLEGHQHPQGPPSNLDYSSFIASLPPYSL